jgi:hypothetical protein
MPLTFSILPRHTLIVACYEGIAGLDETIAKAAECASHPDFDPAMRHLVDLRALTGYERDFPKYFAMQATVMEKFLVPGGGHMFVYLAPTRAGQEMAQMVRRSWDGLDHIIVRIVEHEAEALAILGLRERKLADVLASTG